MKSESHIASEEIGIVAGNGGETKESEKGEESTADLWSDIVDSFATLDVFGGSESRLADDTPCGANTADDSWFLGDPFNFSSTNGDTESTRKENGDADTNSVDRTKECDVPIQDWTEMIFGTSTTDEKPTQLNSSYSEQTSTQPPNKSSDGFLEIDLSWLFGGPEGDADVPSSDVIREMSIKDLKALIEKAEMTHTDCVEKADLRHRALEAADRLSLTARQPEVVDESVSRRSSVTTIGGLKCIVVGYQGRDPDLVIFFFHGYQASAASLSHVADRIVSTIGSRRDVQFVMPQHPESIWWPIDWTGYMYAMMSGVEEKARILRATPSGVDDCRVMVKRMILEHRAALVNPRAASLDSEALMRLPEHHLFPAQRVAFMGFSQGAMLALDSALGVDKPIAGAVLISGFMIDIELWAKKLSTTQKGIKVMQTHGLNDQLIPFATARWLHELLSKNHASVHWIPHSGGHDMGPPHVLLNIANFILSIGKDR